MDIVSLAKQLGQLIAQTPEYQRYNRSSLAVNEDQELTGLITKLQDYEKQVGDTLRAGGRITEELKNEYETFLGDIQGRTKIQDLIASQENYLKLMNRVNDLIAEGISEGGKSRIITSF
jgi:cell fate (sporulation/competence/biofilm development) regulator YlbF (YheA/YmcA/DUF963 family)